MVEGRCVLVVEDEAKIRKLVVEGLKGAGFDVLEAESGEQALDLLRQHGDAIGWLFTDIRLPGVINGWNVAFEYRFHNPTRPVVYATGYDPASGSPVHGSIVFQKPYRPSQIVEAFQRLSQESAA